MLLFALVAIRFDPPLPSVPVLTAAAVARAFADHSAPPTAPLQGPDILEPDLHGVVDVPAYLAAQESLADAEPVPNPFRRRYHPPLPARDVPFALTAILNPAGSPAGSCIINSQVSSVGDLMEGMMIAAIDVDGVVLQGPHFRVRVPLQEQPVTIRLPR